MLQKCVSLDPAYTPAYLVLAKMANGPTTGALLRHIVHLQPKNPDYLAEYASWLHQNGKFCVLEKKEKKFFSIKSDDKKGKCKKKIFYHNLEKWLPALNYYLKAITISPVHKYSLLGTAKILRSRGQWSRVHQLITR